VLHLHGRRRSMTNIDVRVMDMSVARKTIIFNMMELAGNIWSAEPLTGP
jgi:hypothetical protein